MWGPYESPETKGLLAKIAIGAFLALVIISLPTAIMELMILQRIKAGENMTRFAELSDALRMIFGIAYLIFFLAALIVFLVWTHRVYKNLPHLTDKPLFETPGWAVGGFFVPFLNLYKPFKVFREIYQHSDVRKEFANSALVGVWWAFWLLDNVSGQLQFRITMKAETVEAFIMSDILEIALWPLTFISVILWLMLVKRITRLQTEGFNYRRLQQASTPAPTPASGFAPTQANVLEDNSTETIAPTNG